MLRCQRVWVLTAILLVNFPGVVPFGFGMAPMVGCFRALPARSRGLTWATEYRRQGAAGLLAQRESNEYSEEDEENMEMMKKQRQLPFDKGASEFVPTDMQVFHVCMCMDVCVCVCVSMLLNICVFFVNAYLCIHMLHTHTLCEYA